MVNLLLQHVDGQHLWMLKERGRGCVCVVEAHLQQEWQDATAGDTVCLEAVMLVFATPVMVQTNGWICEMYVQDVLKDGVEEYYHDITRWGAAGLTVFCLWGLTIVHRHWDGIVVPLRQGPRGWVVGVLRMQNFGAVVVCACNCICRARAVGSGVCSIVLQCLGIKWYAGRQ